MCVKSCPSLRQRSKVSSVNHLQLPFQVRPGSILRAFKTIAREPRPQKAGSFCVMNCCESGKKDSRWPLWRDSRNIFRPSVESKGTTVSGRGFWWKEGAALIDVSPELITSVVENFGEDGRLLESRIREHCAQLWNPVRALISANATAIRCGESSNDDAYAGRRCAVCDV